MTTGVKALLVGLIVALLAVCAGATILVDSARSETEATVALNEHAAKSATNANREFTRLAVKRVCQAWELSISGGVQGVAYSLPREYVQACMNNPLIAP